MEMTTVTALLILPFALALSALTFRSIVRRYRAPWGFPWLSSVAFAAAALTAVLALHVLSRS